MELEIRYARASDGTSIAYTQLGSGPPVLFSDWGFRFEAILAAKFLLHERLLTHARVTYFDHPGVGASDRNIDGITVDGLVRATEAAADASMRDERFTLIAHSASCLGAAVYADTHAERIERLICIAPTLLSGNRPALPDWSMVRRLRAAAQFPDGPVERQRWVSQTMRDSMSHAIWLSALREYDRHDQIAAFAQLRVPTLIIAPDRPEEYRDNAARLSSAAQGSRLMLVESRDANTDDRAVAEACLEFMGIQSRIGRGGSRNTTAVILFTDIADSTALTERIGDVAFRSVERSLDDGIRRAIRASGGTPVEGKVLGDGVMGSFVSASDAIMAAGQCLEVSGVLELPIHIGLHAGDVIREKDNVYGGAVNIASRICGLCAPGEILVSQTIRDLARTSAGVAFEDRGQHALKGIADPVRVFAVRPASG